jgi:D-arabinono-1,4-lactone oxidase
MQANDSFIAPPSMALHSFAPEDLRVMSTETAVPCGSAFPSAAQEAEFQQRFPDPATHTAYARAVHVVEYAAAAVRRLGKGKLTMPLNFRYCMPSTHFMSMTHENPDQPGAQLFLMVELPLSLEQDSKRVNKVHLVAAHLERYLVEDLGGRPHWGKVQRLRLASCKHPLSEPYSTHLPAWNRVRRQLDPSGTFSTPFASQVTVGLIRKL